MYIRLRKLQHSRMVYLEHNIPSLVTIIASALWEFMSPGTSAYSNGNTSGVSSRSNLSECTMLVKFCKSPIPNLLYPYYLSYQQSQDHVHTQVFKDTCIVHLRANHFVIIWAVSVQSCEDSGNRRCIRSLLWGAWCCILQVECLCLMFCCMMYSWWWELPFLNRATIMLEGWTHQRLDSIIPVKSGSGTCGFASTYKDAC